MIDWVILEYPNVWHVVEVKYKGDITITTCRTKANEEPKIKDNVYGFTQNFINYNDACKYAVSVAKELNIPTCIKSVE